MRESAMSLVSRSWPSVTFGLSRPRGRRLRELLLQRWAPCRLCWGLRGSLSVFDIHMTDLKGLPETWALMQPSYFALMLMMTRFSVLVLGDCAKLCLIAWAMFDSLVFFFAYFVYAHELCS